MINSCDRSCNGHMPSSWAEHKETDLESRRLLQKLMPEYISRMKDVVGFERSIVRMAQGSQ